MRTIHKHITLNFLITVFFVCTINGSIAQSKYGPKDTILTVAVVYDGDTIEAKTLAGVYLWARNNIAMERWTRLRNAVYVTYPYAKKAGVVFNDIQKHIA